LTWNYPIVHIVHKVIVAHGGRIEVGNRPGEDATFVIFLLLREERDA